METWQHTWHKCNDEDCQICNGGLHWCVICNAAEGELLTHCPGYRLNGDTLNACYHGNVIDLAAKGENHG